MNPAATTAPAPATPGTVPAGPPSPGAPSGSAAAVPGASGRRNARRLAAASAVVLLLAVVSTFVGVLDVTPWSLWHQLVSGDADGFWASTEILAVSRLPRTASVVLAGTALAVAGLIMQLMVRNKFVEPSTVGTVESASAGLLVVSIFLPAAPLMAKMGFAAVFAVAGTALFLLVLQRVPLRNTLLVPLVGIMLGNVIASLTTFFAYRFDLLQTLNSWMIGDFSGVIRGRYELLWLVLALTVVGYVAADRFTVAGMGQEFTTNLGIDYRRVMALGLTLVALISAVVVVTIGSIPFLGLVVPNLVSMLIGDNVRRTVPWVAVFGAGFVLVCDIVARVIRYPYEIPVGTIVAVVGAALFLTMLLRGRRR
ncbi:iron ABC transporter permease [Kocuria dechangensis]|uniref:Iron ABC transporter permease n=1 Tax=Kocuria dechangensis TaxID=1176249 RepID=A0A917GLF2_9MICC|nr:ABC transporter permease [Kocuria dechangensis]GGG51122.1 iron ABC transporter permease [Kocuria dechangensis]